MREGEERPRQRSVHCPAKTQEFIRKRARAAGKTVSRYVLDLARADDRAQPAPRPREHKNERVRPPKRAKALEDCHRLVRKRDLVEAIRQIDDSGGTNEA